MCAWAPKEFMATVARMEKERGVLLVETMKYMVRRKHGKGYNYGRRKLAKPKVSDPPTRNGCFVRCEVCWWMPLSPPPPGKNNPKTRTKTLRIIRCSNRTGFALLVGLEPCRQICPFVSALSTAVSEGCPPPPSPCLGILCVAWRNQPLSTSSLCDLSMKQSAASATPWSTCHPS